MAEQNRKTPEQKRMREAAERVVEDYLDFVFADSDARDIARESRHILGTYSDHGELPSSSGFAGFCTLGARVDRMRRCEVTEAMRRACDIMGKVKDGDLINALCIDRMYRGKTRAVATDPLNGKVVEIAYKAAHCADKLGLSQDAYRKRVSRGYQDLEAILFPSQRAA